MINLVNTVDADALAPCITGSTTDTVLIILMALCKTKVSPVLMHWRYHSLALSHCFDIDKMLFKVNSLSLCHVPWND